MIDIHNHTLFGVDDGPEKIETSLEMLKSAQQAGITDLIMTPHYRTGMFESTAEKISSNFEQLKSAAAVENISVRLYLGCEYHVDDGIFENMGMGRTRTLADSDYILMEYKYETPFEYILEQTKKAVSCDFIPVIAHVERYGCLMRNPLSCHKLQREGALIQCNANALLGNDGKAAALFCSLLIRLGFSDIIASDAHDLDRRANHLKEAWVYTAGHFGEKKAAQLFCTNPGRIIIKK